jgi:hypothetical protein
MLYALLPSHIHATSPAHLILLDLFTRIIIGDNIKTIKLRTMKWQSMWDERGNREKQIFLIVNPTERNPV